MEGTEKSNQRGYKRSLVAYSVPIFVYVLNTLTSTCPFYNHPIRSFHNPAIYSVQQGFVFSKTSLCIRQNTKDRTAVFCHAIPMCSLSTQLIILKGGKYKSVIGQTANLFLNMQMMTGSL